MNVSGFHHYTLSPFYKIDGCSGGGGRIDILGGIRGAGGFFVDLVRRPPPRKNPLEMHPLLIDEEQIKVLSDQLRTLKDRNPTFYFTILGRIQEENIDLYHILTNDNNSEALTSEPPVIRREYPNTLSGIALKQFIQDQNRNNK